VPDDLPIGGDVDLLRRNADAVHAAVAAMPDRDAELIRFRFGLDGDGRWTLEEVGDAWGVSKEAERVRQDRIMGELWWKLASRVEKA